MKNLLSLFALALSIALVSCSDDDAAPSIDFPLVVTPTNTLVKEDIKVYSKENGTVTEITVDDTDLDDDSAFTDIDNEPSFDTITFVSEGVAEFTQGTEVITGTYSISGNTINFTASQEFGGITITLTFEGEGDPEDFRIKSQVSLSGDDTGSFSVSGPGQTDLQTLQNDLSDGETLVVLNYTEQYTK